MKPGLQKIRKVKRIALVRLPRLRHRMRILRGAKNESDVANVFQRTPFCMTASIVLQSRAPSLNGSASPGWRWKRWRRYTRAVKFEDSSAANDGRCRPKGWLRRGRFAAHVLYVREPARPRKLASDVRMCLGPMLARRRPALSGRRAVAIADALVFTSRRWRRLRERGGVTCPPTRRPRGWTAPSGNWLRQRKNTPQQYRPHAGARPGPGIFAPKYQATDRGSS
jgi:hypothetical protein